MSQIIIREKDLSSNPSAQLTEIAYVPGFSTSANAANLVGRPILYNDLSTFKAEVGDQPFIFTADATIAYGSSRSQKFKEGDADTGYLYAVELLQQGLPVLYEVVKAEPTSAQDMYDALAGVQSTTTEKTSSTFGPFDGIITLNSDGFPIVTCGFADVQFNKSDIVSIESISLGGDSSLGECRVLDNDFTISSVSPEQGDDWTGVDLIFGKGAIFAQENGTSLAYARDLAVEGNVEITLALNIRTDGSTETESILSKLRDRGTYNFKYLTTGGYPVFEYADDVITKKLLEIAGAVNNTTDDREDTANGRGDVIAFIDHLNDKTRTLNPTDADSVFYVINHSFVDSLSVNEKECLANATMFTPWATYNLANAFTNNGEQIVNYDLPASFAYLTCLAKMLGQTVPTYDAIAGVSRGTVTNIAIDSTTGEYKVLTDEVLTNYIANQYQIVMEDKSGKISINALTQINPYGIVIYGDRTLLPSSRIDGVKASCILNIRSIVCDVKKQLYVAARRYMFQQNSDILWINFKSMITPLLEQMVSGYGIKSYQITKDTIKSTKNSIFANITIVPIYPVEKFDITVNITDDDVTVSED